MSETEKKTEAAKQEAIKETTLPTPDPKTPIRPDDKPEPDPRTPVKELLEQCAEDKAARRLKRKRVVKFVIVLTLYLLFLVWVQSWLGLLVVPFIYDAYISRKIDWYWWRKSKNSALRYVMGWVDAIVFALVAIYFLNQFFFQNYVIPSSSLEKTLLTGDYLLVSKVSYGPRIPQTPLTMPLTQHTLPVLNTKSYLEWPHWEYRRVKGLGEVRRGDIVVFNYPAGDTVALLCQNQDYYRMAYQIGAQATCVLPTQEMDYATQQQIFSGLYATGKQVMAANPQEFGEIVARPVDRRENYVKRCVALPGDTFLMRNDVIYINGKAQAQPENVQLGYVVSFREYPSEYLRRRLGITAEDMSHPMSEDGLTFYMPLTAVAKNGLTAAGVIASIRRAPGETAWLYPLNMVKDWSTSDYGGEGFVIPKKGSPLRLTLANLPIYERVIRDYEGNKLEVRGGKIYINGQLSDSYTPKFNHYWMMGDNRDNSADSRFWCFVPEDHVVGKPLFVWLSLDPDYGLANGKIRWERFFKWVGDIK